MEGAVQQSEVNTSIISTVQMVTITATDPSWTALAIWITLCPDVRLGAVTGPSDDA